VNAAQTQNTPDGLSWASAFTTIQPAVDAADTAGGGEVWVAASSYGGYIQDTLAVVVSLKPAVKVYGGFVGTETSRDDRNWQTHVTIVRRTDSTGRVVRIDNAPNSLFDGFTVSGGRLIDDPSYTNGGGGMLIDSTGPVTVSHCVFTNNAAGAYKGGAVSIVNAGPISLDHCTFMNNNAGMGGALAVANAAGAMAIDACMFVNNSSINGYGGAVNSESPAFSAVNCVFAGNTASGGDLPNGGAYAGTGGTSSFMNCSFTGNTAGAGGAIFHAITGGPGTETTLTNCIVQGDSQPELSVDTAYLTVTYSDLQGVTGGPWPGTGNLGVDPNFVSATDLHLQGSSPCIDKGASTGAPSVDIEGHTRPVDGVDMGAYEYIALK
jgi:hypothetical protein